MSTKQFWLEFRAHRNLVSGPWCQRNHGSRIFQRKPAWLAATTALSAPWRAAGVRKYRLEAIGSDHYQGISKGQTPLKISKSPSFPVSHSPGDWPLLSKAGIWGNRWQRRNKYLCLSSPQLTNAEEQTRVEDGTEDRGGVGLKVCPSTLRQTGFCFLFFLRPVEAIAWALAEVTVDVRSNETDRLSWVVHWFSIKLQKKKQNKLPRFCLPIYWFLYVQTWKESQIKEGLCPTLNLPWIKIRVCLRSSTNLSFILLLLNGERQSPRHILIR